MKKGVALIWVLILSSILLIISSTMVAYITKESRFSVQIEESSAAYSAAKSGVEWADEELSLNPGFRTAMEGTKLIIAQESSGSPETSAQVIVKEEDGSVIIESTGEKSNVRRKLEYKISTLVGTVQEPAVGLSVGSNSESFTFTFDFWGTGTGKLGLKNPAAPESMLFMDFNGSNFTFTAKDSIRRLEQIRTILLPDTNGDGFPDYGPGIYRAKIKYIKGTAALIKIQKRIVSPGEVQWECQGTALLDLSQNSFDMGDLSAVYADPETVVVNPSGALPSDTAYQFGDFYIDNLHILK